MWLCCCYPCVKIMKHIPKKLLLLVIIIDLLLKDYLINFIVNKRSNRYTPNLIGEISILIAVVFFQTTLLSLLRSYQIYSFQQIENFNCLYEKLYNSLFKGNLTSKLTKKMKIGDIKYIVVNFYEDQLWKIIQLILFSTLTSFLIRIINSYLNINYSLYYFGSILLSYCVFLSFKLNRKIMDDNNNNENLKKKIKKKI